MADGSELYLVRNLRAWSEAAGVVKSAEYQVFADAQIIGAIEYGPYYFTIWEMGPKKEGEERWLCLRIKTKAPPTPTDERPWETASRSGFYHGGGIPSELVSLSSLFLRRRLKLGPVVRWDDSPMSFIVRGDGWIDPQIVTGQSNLAELAEWFKLIEDLNPDMHQAFILASKLYDQALQLIEDNPDLAYLNLVSSIEVLAQNFDVGQVYLRDLDAGLAACVERISDPGLKLEIENRIIARERLIARRFVQFIVAHTDTSFWQAPNRPNLGRIDPAQLPMLLERIYRQRSRTFHTGEPFPANLLHPAISGAEIDFVLGVSVGERSWGPEDFIPYPWFFERLVNHVLKNYLTRNQAR